MASKKKETHKNTEELILRLEEEFDEVAGRLERLTSALSTGDKFIKKVGEEQYNLLVDQHNAMMDYRNILAIRISLLKRTAKNGGK